MQGMMMSELIVRLEKPEDWNGWNIVHANQIMEFQQKRLAELEAALESTNNELSASITRLNTLKSVAPAHDVNEPDYSDFQTCHENSVLLSKHKQPAKEQGS
jgi:hypothetical protein